MPVSLVAAALLSAPLSKQGKVQVLKVDSSKPCDKPCSDTIFKQHNGNTMGWQARCKWENCQGCSACENKAWLNEGTGPDDTEDLLKHSKKEGGAAAKGGPDDGETPLAAPAYDPVNGYCQGWCKPKNNATDLSWADKCTYLTCQGCDRCSLVASRAELRSESEPFPPKPSPTPPTRALPSGASSSSWNPSIPNAKLTIIVQEDKTGSSTLRHTLLSAADAGVGCLLNLKIEYRLHGANKRKDIGSCTGSAVLFGEFGGCDEVSRQPCGYITTIREPVARIISEYNYFCKNCQDHNKFCGRLASFCGNGQKRSLVDWAGKFANQYTHHFSRSWGRDKYYGAYLEGFAGMQTPNDQTYQHALANLTAPQQHIVFTEDMTSDSWTELDQLLDYPIGTLAAHEQVTNRIEEHKDAYDKYEPTDEDFAKVAELNSWDVKLYEALRGRA